METLPRPVLAERGLVNVELVTPAPWNARVDHDVPGIIASIRRFGFRDPIEVIVQIGDEEQPAPQLIVAGAGRYLAMREMGYTEIPAELQVWDSMASARGYGLANNKLTDSSRFDRGTVLSTLEDLAPLPQGLTGTGFDLGDLDEMRRQEHGPEDGADRVSGDEDELPDEAGEVITKLGDVWTVGAHRVMCGDSTDRRDLKRLLDVDADLCFTSPPYGDQRTYEGAGNLDPRHLAQFVTTVCDRCDLFAVNLGIVRRDHAVLPYWDAYLAAAADASYPLLSWNVWDRTGSGFTVGQSTAMFAIEHEFVFVFGQPRKLNRTIPNTDPSATWKKRVREADGSVKDHGARKQTGRYRQLGTVFHATPARGTSEESHPATFPVALPEAYIAATTVKGGVIYDPFLGSGTTMVAAHKLERSCYGMELNPRYVDLALRRMADTCGVAAVRESDSHEIRPSNVHRESAP